MRPTGHSPSIGFLSTYPPTACGLATFTASLRGAIAEERRSNRGLGVVSLVEGRRSKRTPGVLYEHLNGDRASATRAIGALNSFDVVSVQHEYGIFGQRDGAEVLDLMAGLDVPAVVTLHTVLAEPTDDQRSILEEVVARAHQTIVMSQAAHSRLINGYRIDPEKVRVIPHGARPISDGPPAATGTRPVILTWGLIGPGKGLEMAIDAVAGLKDIRPLPRYTILGKTHPKVQAYQGDTYRNGLLRRAADLGLTDVVEFDDRYLDLASLSGAISAATAVVLPYESTEQVTSGVLVEALAAGKPVIATAFPHAAELLADGAGILVPHNDSLAMGAALRKVLTDPSLATAMAAEARRVGATMHWPAVARSYHELALEVVGTRRTAPVVTLAGHKRGVTDGLAKVS